MEEDGDCIKKPEGEAGKKKGAMLPGDHAHGDPMSRLIAFGALCHSNHCSRNLVVITTRASL